MYTHSPVHASTFVPTHTHIHTDTHAPCTLGYPQEAIKTTKYFTFSDPDCYNPRLQLEWLGLVSALGGTQGPGKKRLKRSPDTLSTPRHLLLLQIKHTQTSHSEGTSQLLQHTMSLFEFSLTTTKSFSHRVNNLRALLSAEPRLQELSTKPHTLLTFTQNPQYFTHDPRYS